jgi:hypothetical protein
MPSLKELDDPKKYPPLDPARFDISHDVPVFDEHCDEEPLRDEVTGDIILDEQGNPKTRQIRYSRDVLESIAENLNRRIRDTADYTALSIEHTPTPEQRANGIKGQEVVGFAGPYYVAPWGKENPRPTIYARNWATFKEDTAKASKYPRRSVELWAERNIHDRYFDPISLLGAVTPRRDLGLHYSRVNEGRPVPVYRYDACFASGTNTFMPSAGDDAKKKRYENHETPETDAMSIDESDIQRITEAVMQSAPMQWVAQQMAAEQAKGTPTEAAAPPAPEAGAPGAAPPAADPAAPAAPPAHKPHTPPPGHEAPGASQPGKDAPDAAPPGVPKKRFEKSDEQSAPVAGEAIADEPTLEDAAALVAEATGTAAAEPEPELETVGAAPPVWNYSREQADKIRYAQIERENRTMRAELDKANKLAEQARSEARFVKRYSQVESLAQEFLLDPERELQRAEVMDDAQWEDHLGAIKQYRRNPVGRAPLPVAEAEAVAVDGNDLHARVRTKIDRYSREGKRFTYQEVLDETKKEMAAK